MGVLHRESMLALELGKLALNQPRVDGQIGL